MDLHHEAYTILTDTNVNVTGGNIVHLARSALRLLQPCICGPLDKNPSGIWIICPQLYLATLYKGYLASAGLRLHPFPKG